MFSKLELKNKLLNPVETLGNTGGFYHIKQALERCINKQEIQSI